MSGPGSGKVALAASCFISMILALLAAINLAGRLEVMERRYSMLRGLMCIGSAARRDLGPETTSLPVLGRSGA
jgi:hypothetical protein